MTVTIGRRELLAALGGAAAAWPLAARAQREAKTARIGFLGADTQSGIESRVERFRAGLRDFGYVEGDNIFIDFRWAEGNYARLAEFAAELVRLKVDLLATYGTPGTLAAKQATTTVPIVMIVSGDAVATGIVASLARPGGNVTGLTFFSPELNAKGLELLKEGFPSASRVAILLNPGNPPAPEMGTQRRRGAPRAPKSSQGVGTNPMAKLEPPTDAFAPPGCRRVESLGVGWSRAREIRRVNPPGRGKREIAMKPAPSASAAIGLLVFRRRGGVVGKP